MAAGLRTRQWFALFVGAGLLLSGCSAVPPAPPLAAGPAAAAPAAPADVTGPRQQAVAPSVAPAQAVFQATQAKAHLDMLAVTIGSRPAGSPNYQKAADYAAQRFADYGYTVERQEFSFSEYTVDTVELTVIGTGKPPLDVSVIQNSAGGDVEGVLVPAGVGRPSDFPAAVRGNIALIQRGADITFADKIAAAAAAGAKAVVIYNNQTGLFSGNAPRQTAIPAITVSKENGEQLLAGAESGALRVRAFVDATTREIKTENVIAKKPGSGSGLIVVGAHLDTVAAGPGANDNGSGSVAVLELARALSGQNLAAELQFVLFGAEENGLIGSRRFVEKLNQADRARLLGMLNLDMVGVGDRMRLAGNARLVGLAKLAADAKSLPVSELTGNAAGGSDHAPFLQAGLPAMFLHWTDDPNYHAPTDKAEFVLAERLQVSGDVALATILSLSERHD